MIVADSRVQAAGHAHGHVAVRDGPGPAAAASTGGGAGGRHAHDVLCLDAGTGVRPGGPTRDQRRRVVDTTEHADAPPLGVGAGSAVS